MPTQPSPDLGGSVEEALVFAAAALGPVVRHIDRSWPHGESLVLEVAAADGRAAYVKHHRQERKFRTELLVYQRVLAGVGDVVPRLLAHDEDRGLLLLSAVAGRPADELGRHRDPDVHRAAGDVLRALHEAPVPSGDLLPCEAPGARLARWLAAAPPGSMTAAGAAACEQLVGDLPPATDGVVAHADWQPRNWMVDGGAVRAIDFEHARVDHWTADIVKLWWHTWPDRGDLRSAFFEGYGRTLSDGDVRRFAAVSAVHLVSTAVWAEAHGDPAYAAEAQQALRQLVTKEWEEQWEQLPP